MNRKLIAIIAGIISVFSIALVTLFGIQAEELVVVVPVTGIEVYKDPNNKIVKEGGLIVVPLEADQYILKYKIFPENATDKTIYISPSIDELSIYEDEGLIEFHEVKGIFLITITTRDGNFKRSFHIEHDLKKDEIL